MPIKFILMLLQFLLIIFVLVTRVSQLYCPTLIFNIFLQEEYVYQGIPSRYGQYSAEYNHGDRSVLAASLIFLVLIFLEFVTLTFGISLLFNKINAFQIVLHFIGCLGTIWQILNLNQFTMMWSLMAFFGIIPFVLEVSVILLAFTRYHVIDQVEQI